MRARLRRRSKARASAASRRGRSRWRRRATGTGCARRAHPAAVPVERGERARQPLGAGARRHRRLGVLGPQRVLPLHLRDAHRGELGLRRPRQRGARLFGNASRGRTGRSSATERPSSRLCSSCKALSRSSDARTKAAAELSAAGGAAARAAIVLSSRRRDRAAGGIALGWRPLSRRPRRGTARANFERMRPEWRRRTWRVHVATPLRRGGHAEVALVADRRARNSAGAARRPGRGSATPPTPRSRASRRRRRGDGVRTRTGSRRRGRRPTRRARASAGSRPSCTPRRSGARRPSASRRRVRRSSACCRARSPRSSRSSSSCRPPSTSAATRRARSSCST